MPRIGSWIVCENAWPSLGSATAADGGAPSASASSGHTDTKRIRYADEQPPTGHAKCPDTRSVSRSWSSSSAIAARWRFACSGAALSCATVVIGRTRPAAGPTRSSNRLATEKGSVATRPTRSIAVTTKATRYGSRRRSPPDARSASGSEVGAGFPPGAVALIARDVGARGRALYRERRSLVSDPGQPVDAARVVLMAVLAHAVRALAIGPVEELAALADPAIRRHAVAARVGDPLERDPDDAARAQIRREEAGERAEVRVRVIDDLAAPIEADDLRRSLERAEEKRDAAVLPQVRDRLDAAAGQVEVGDRPRSEDAEAVEALRRDVHVPVAARGRGPDEEHPLREQERPQGVVDRFVRLSHLASGQEVRMPKAAIEGPQFLRLRIRARLTSRSARRSRAPRRCRCPWP